MRRRILIGVGILVVLLLAGLPVLLGRQEEPQVRARLVALAGEASGYARAEGPVPLSFPQDHGPHPDYQTEWWYYTGNLETAKGQRFGYQLTFFRRALVPPAERRKRASAWATDQVYMAHLALTDVEGKQHQAFERLARGAAGLAGAVASPYRVWLEDWSAAEIEPGVVRLRAAQEGLALDLLLVDQKGPILQGNQGYSQKGPEPGNASYYYSLTRLASSGKVRAGGVEHEVSGLSWMDHEFSTSSLTPDQVGWDWFSVQLDDGSELMVFQLRKEDSSVDPFSSGTFVAPDGSTRRLGRDDFQVGVQDRWLSPHTGATYPARWTVAVPALELAVEVVPYLSHQELNVSYSYWEGAVGIEGERGGRPVRGHGYVELTGYAGTMQGQF